MIPKPLTVTEYVRDTLECKGSDVLAAYAQRVLPPDNTDYTANFMDADDLVLIARMLGKSVTVYRVQYGTDTQGGGEGLPMDSPHIGRSAKVYHSEVGGPDGDPVSIVLDDHNRAGASDGLVRNSGSSHFVGVTQRTAAVPIECAFNACPDCVGAVTEKDVLDGHWSVSHVLLDDRSDAPARLVCQPCVDYLDGASAERFVAGEGDLHAAVSCRSQHVVHKSLDCHLYTVPDESAADALSGMGPGAHPSGPLFAEGSRDEWVTSRFPAEVLQAVAPTAETVKQTRQFLMTDEHVRRIAGEHIDQEAMHAALETTHAKIRHAKFDMHKFDLTTEKGRVNACHARLYPAGSAESSEVSDEDERRSKMATLPFTRPEEVPISQNHTNQQIHAKLDTIKSAPDVPLARAPYTTYVPLQPEPRFEGKLPMPWDLFSEGLWARIEGMSAALQKELQRVYDKVKQLEASGNPQPGEVKFDYSVLDEWCDGKGSDGLIIEECDFVEKYRPWTWSFEDYHQDKSQPCTPVYNEDVRPSETCALKLADMLAEAARINFPDMQIVNELCTDGLRNRSKLDRRCVLQPNYAGFYKFMEQNGVKREEKLAADPPRLRRQGPTPPFVPFRVVPKNVVMTISETGVIKYRATSDYGAPRSRSAFEFTGTDEDHSVNARIDLDNPEDFPDFSYATVARVGRQIAIMAASGFGITRFKSDFKAYFETLPRAYKDWWCQIQCVDPDGMFEADCQGVFGCREMPALSSRVSMFYVALMNDRLQRVQLAWLRLWLDEAVQESHELERVQLLREVIAGYHEGLRESPPDDAAAVFLAREGKNLDVSHQNKVLEWMRMRQTTPDKNKADWWCMDIFIDDSFGGVFDFFAAAFKIVFTTVWQEYGIDVADDKTEIVDDPSAVMQVLGLSMRLDRAAEGQGILELPPDKVKKYRAAGALIIATADANKGKVPIQMVERFLGQMLFACQAIPSLKGDWQMVLHQVQQGMDVRRARRSEVTVPIGARFLIDSMLLKVAEENGVSLFPREGRAGSDGDRVVFRFSDAAKNDGIEGDAYVGCGSWQWVEGSDQIQWYSTEFSRMERKALEINALELLNVIIGEEVFRESTGFSADVIACCDNLNAVVHILNGAKAKAGPLRAIYRKRIEMMLSQIAKLELGTQLPAHRIIGCHVLREYNKEADLLSRGLVTDFKEAVNRRFGREMQFVEVSVDNAQMRQTSGIVRAALADEAYKRLRSLQDVQAAAAQRLSQVLQTHPVLAKASGGESFAQAATPQQMARAVTMLMSLPPGLEGFQGGHASAFMFQAPDKSRWVGSAAHCFPKCARCQACSQCASGCRLFRLVPPSNPGDPTRARYNDCATCRACHACAQYTKTITFSLHGYSPRFDGLRINRLSLCRNNFLDIAVAQFDRASEVRIASRGMTLPAIEICCDPLQDAMFACTVAHHRRGFVDECRVATAKAASDAVSVRYSAVEPHAFGGGASGSAGVTDNNQLLFVHYAGGSARDPQGTLAETVVTGFGTLAVNLIGLLPTKVKGLRSTWVHLNPVDHVTIERAPYETAMIGYDRTGAVRDSYATDLIKGKVKTTALWPHGDTLSQMASDEVPVSTAQILALTGSTVDSDSTPGEISAQQAVACLVYDTAKMPGGHRPSVAQCIAARNAARAAARRGETPPLWWMRGAGVHGAAVAGTNYAGTGRTQPLWACSQCAAQFPARIGDTPLRELQCEACSHAELRKQAAPAHEAGDEPCTTT